MDSRKVKWNQRQLFLIKINFERYNRRKRKESLIMTKSENLSITQQAENLINHLEQDKTIFTNDERNLIVNYAYKLEDVEKTRELAENLAFVKENSPNNAALIVKDAQAEIDAVDMKSEARTESTPTERASVLKKLESYKEHANETNINPAPHKIADKEASR